MTAFAAFAKDNAGFSCRMRRLREWQDRRLGRRFASCGIVWRDRVAGSCGGVVCGVVWRGRLSAERPGYALRRRAVADESGPPGAHPLRVGPPEIVRPKTKPPVPSKGTGGCVAVAADAAVGTEAAATLYRFAAFHRSAACRIANRRRHGERTSGYFFSAFLSAAYSSLTLASTAGVMLSVVSASMSAEALMISLYLLSALISSTARCSRSCARFVKT